MGRLRVEFDLEGWESRSLPKVRAILRPLLGVLIEENRVYLLNHPNTPKLYDSGVRYQREARGKETWQNIGACLRTGKADCEDLAAWRVAELRAQGIAARPRVTVRKRGDGSWLYHVFIAVGNVDEDPSRKLGMNASEGLFGWAHLCCRCSWVWVW